MIPRAVLVAALVLVGAIAPPATAKSLGPGPAGAFAGVGAWVSVFDDAAWARPERSVADMHRRGVETLYLQSASSAPGPAVHRPDVTGRFLRAAHVRGMSVVAWYLPPYVRPAYELRRALGAIRFRSARGDRFDAFGLDIETAPGSPAAPVRNRRVLRLSRRLRAAVGDAYSLGAIIPSPHGLTLPTGRRWWPDFPYRGLARSYDAFLPMGYYTYHGQGPRVAYRDTRRNIELLRRETGDADVPIHVIGGTSDASGRGEGRAFRRAINRFGAIGASMYSYPTMDGADWAALTGLRFLPVLPVPAAASASGPRPVRLTLAASGDLLIHSPVWERARANAGGRGYDFRPMLRFVRPVLRRADLALCHAETPLSARAPLGYPTFRTPRALARAAKWAGYDACSTASNHSLDQGQGGIAETRRALRRAGLAHTGSFATAAQRRRPTILEAKGVKVAFLSYTEATNGIPLPHPWSVNLARVRRILADARRARRAGAQVVVVNLHWGAEYASVPSAAQRRLADRLTRDDTITAVVGQAAHVVQPISRVNGRLVVFGEGNLLSNQSAACCPAASQDGIVALLRIVVRPGGARVIGVDYVPTWVRRTDYAVLPVGLALRRGLAPASLLRASWRRTVRVVGRRRGVRPMAGR